jgi:hypothetical protein
MVWRGEEKMREFRGDPPKPAFLGQRDQDALFIKWSLSQVVDEKKVAKGGKKSRC